MLSRKKTLAHTARSTGLPAALPRLPHLQGAGHAHLVCERKGLSVTLPFTDSGFFWDQALAYLIRDVLFHLNDSIFRTGSRVTAGSITGRFMFCPCNCSSPGPSVPSSNLHSWTGFSWEIKRLEAHRMQPGLCVQQTTGLKGKVTRLNIFFGNRALMDGSYRGQSNETWVCMATLLSEQTIVRFVAVHQLYVSSHKDRANAVPKVQKKCFLVKPAQ